MIPTYGDYERRHTGMLHLMRPSDLHDYDILVAEMRAGVADQVPPQLATGYAILRAYARAKGRSLGAECHTWTHMHPMLYLQSALAIQGTASQWPHLVITAYEEFIHG